MAPVIGGIGYYARTAPDTTAIASLGPTLTFEELDDRQRRLVGALKRAGVRRNQRIAVLGSNSIGSLEVVTGALRGGIVPVPINPLLTEPEIAYILEDSGARWLFTDRSMEHQSLDRVVMFGDAYERLLHEAKPGRIASFALGRPMHYTSGTTGSPKGVWVKPQPERRAMQHSERFRRLWAMTSEDIHLVASPLAHSAPLRFALRSLEAGGTVVLLGKFDPEETFAAIDLFSITSTFMVPTHLERILKLGWNKLGKRDMSSLRLLAHAGAPIRESTKREAIELFPHGSLWEFYGATEGQATRISTDEWLRKPGSVGRAIPGVEILIADGTGTELPRGETGEIWIGQPKSERWSYWGDKPKTRAAWRGNAFSVGDVGRLDEDGYLFIEGRKHDTIITGGVNVYPQEVEAVLASHPAVADVMVYGVDDDDWGQRVCAAVVAKYGHPLDPDRLKSWTRERLAGYKTPRVIEVWDELPRTPTGKLRRPGPGDRTGDPA
jgi:acyl-CoA synthetase (AMP-forming)/AMP-acid ligase II